MIIYSKEPLNVMMKNILLLDDPYTGGYVYVSKETYDQAISLSITFNQDVGRVKGTISGKGMLNWAANKVISHVVSLCSERFASPISMLAPYLAYTLPIGVEWPEDDKEIVAMAYGVLHQMSQFTNFYGTALMPSGSKADISIPKNIIMAYEESWKAQIETLGDCVVAVPVFIDLSGSMSSGSTLMYSQVSDGTVSVPVVHEVQHQPAPVQSAVTAQTVVVEKPTATGQASDAESGSTDNNEQTETTVTNEVPEKKEEVADVQTQVQSKVDVNEEKTSETSEEHDAESDETDAEEDGEEGEEEDMEAKILAMMKAIEDAPAEEFQPKETAKTVEASKPETGVKKDEESVKFGESGSINMTEREIAEGNRRLLSDYDI